MKRGPLKRKTPLRSANPIKRGKQTAKTRCSLTRRSRMAPRNAERRARNYERNYSGPSRDYDSMIRSMPCIAFGRSTDPDHQCSGPIVAAHETPRGMGGANGCWADQFPACARHHDEAGERRTSQRAKFELRYGVDVRQVADDLAQPLLRQVAMEHLEDPSSVRAHDRDAMFRWVKRRLYRETSVATGLAAVVPFGTAALHVGVALGLLDAENLDAGTLTKVLELCLKATR